MERLGRVNAEPEGPECIILRHDAPEASLNENKLYEIQNAVFQECRLKPGRDTTYLRVSRGYLGRGDPLVAH